MIIIFGINYPSIIRPQFSMAPPYRGTAAMSCLGRGKSTSKNDSKNSLILGPTSAANLCNFD